MKIEEGKYYRTRDGRKVGPMEWSKYGKQFATAPGFAGDQWYTQENQFYSNYVGRVSTHEEYPSDLIAEWTDEPAAPKPSPFVTRRELVPGVYGRVTVCNAGATWVDIHCEAVMTADELDEAAHLFAQLAEYLRETK